MSSLTNLTTDATIKEETNNLGGYSPLETNIYENCNIDLAFITMSAAKAMALNVHMTTADGQKFRQQFWMTSNEQKGCKNFFIHPKTGDKHYLPGFNQANALCLLTLGKIISKCTTEIKVINLYDPKEGKEVPTKVEMLTELLNKKITAGVIKQTVDKRAKDAQSGEYKPTGEVREENEVDKFFRAKDGLTVPEIRAKETVPAFKDKWLEKWQGQVKDKTTKVAGVSNGAPLMPPATGEAAPQADDLFA